MGQHLLGLLLIVFGIMIDSMHCMYTTTTTTTATTTATTTTTEMDPMQDRVKLWPNGRVPYVISEGFDTNSQETINEAIEEFKQKTCVNFEPRLKSDRDYVFFDKIPNGCTSPLGKDCDGGVQYIYLAPDCQRSKADIQHEMMHTLGNV